MSDSCCFRAIASRSPERLYAQTSDLHNWRVKRLRASIRRVTHFAIKRWGIVQCPWILSVHILFMETQQTADHWSVSEQQRLVNRDITVGSMTHAHAHAHRHAHTRTHTRQFSKINISAVWCFFVIFLQNLRVSQSMTPVKLSNIYRQNKPLDIGGE